MMAGLHWTAWLLILVAALPALLLVLVFVSAQKGRSSPDTDPAGERRD